MSSRSSTFFALLSTARCVRLPLAPGSTSAAEIGRLSPVALAYLGDAVFELHARQRLLWPPAKVDDLSSRVQSLACAEGQSTALKDLIAAVELTDDENEWLRRGRNAAGRGPRRLKPQTYREATALETLLGVLYLTDTERLSVILEVVLPASDADAESHMERISTT